MWKKLCAAMAGAGLMACAAPAGAASVVDVNNYNPFFPASGWDALSFFQGGALPYPTTNLYQTWTVGVAGQLTGIDIYGSYTSGDISFGSFHLEVFRGDNLAGAGMFSNANLLGVVSRPFATPRPPGIAYPMSFDFTSANILAQAGEKLTFRLRVDQCAHPSCIRRVTTYSNGSGGQTTGGYAGGSLFIKQGPLAITALATDANFRTFMAPVPEPATWAVMIVGFGVTGARLRRKDRHAGGLVSVAKASARLG